MARILGIDIASDAVRGTMVRASLRRVEVASYAEAPLPHTTPERQAETLREAVRQLTSSFSPAPDYVIVCLGGDHVSLRTLEMPLVARKRITDVLPFELEALLPFPVDQAVVDHQPIDQAAGKMRLLAAAVPRASVAELITVLRNAGVDPREIAAGAAALDGLVSVVPALGGLDAALVIDVGRKRTDVAVIQSGCCHFARTLSVGLEGGTSSLLQSGLHHCLASFRAGGGVAPARAFICGEGALAKGALDWFRSELGIDVELLPLPEVPGAPPELVLFGRATALAARGAGRQKRIDLRQGDLAPARAIGGLRQQGRLLVICAAAVFLAFVFSAYARWTVLDDERDELETELAAVSRELLGEETTSPRRARELLSGGTNQIDPMPPFDAFDMLQATSAAIPADITHDTRRFHVNLDEDGQAGRFQLHGTVASVAERDRIRDGLDAHECIEELELGNTTPSGTDRINYQIEGVMRCPGAARPAGASSKSTGSGRAGHGNR